jgi:hypothetical protein
LFCWYLFPPAIVKPWSKVSSHHVTVHVQTDMSRQLSQTQYTRNCSQIHKHFLSWNDKLPENNVYNPFSA